MSRRLKPPSHLRVDWTDVVEHLPAWLEWVKAVTGFSDNTLAMCLDADDRQVERWRKRRAVPSGGAMAAIVLLAERIPGAHDRLLYPRGRPRATVVREAATDPGDAPPFRPPGDRAA